MNHLMSPREIINKMKFSEDWYRLVNKGDRAELYLYDEIGFFGTTAKAFTTELTQIDATQIDVFVSSIGGSVVDGIAIYNALRAHNAEVSMRVDSMAASIASVIVQAGDKRTMLSGSQMMIHNASGLAMGTADDMREAAKILDMQTANIAEIYAERSGGDAAEYLELMAAETWMMAPEAVENGLADEVIKPTKSKSDSDAGPAEDANDDETTDAGPDEAAAKWAAFIDSARIGS